MNSQECKQLLADHCDTNHHEIAHKWSPPLETEDMLGFVEPGNWTRRSKKKEGNSTARTFYCKQGARQATLRAKVIEHPNNVVEIQLRKWSWG
jgi:hypothetical protein